MLAHVPQRFANIQIQVCVREGGVLNWTKLVGVVQSRGWILGGGRVGSNGVLTLSLLLALSAIPLHCLVVLLNVVVLFFSVRVCVSRLCAFWWIVVMRSRRSASICVPRVVRLVCSCLRDSSVGGCGLV